jgi:hypothetical protein
MGGGLMQLVAYGAQDIYLTGNPQITFFKVVYRRHTNFAMESVEQTLSGSVGFGNKVTATVSRNGDLVGRMYVELDPSAVFDGDKTDADALCPNAGNSLLKEVEVQIGGQMIDKHYNHWLNTWMDLTDVNTSKAVGGVLNNSHCVDHTGDAASLGLGPTTMAKKTSFNIKTGTATFTNVNYATVPLQFWFNRNPGLALPLIALQYHEVKIMITFANLSELIAGTPSTSNHDVGSIKLWADYIYLDTDERRRFAQVSHEYLIEQVQHQAFGANSTTLSLNFNHPVKELVWAGDGGDAGVHGGPGTNAPIQLNGSGGARLRDSTLSDGGTVTLKLNGHERFAPRHHNYFAGTQVAAHHSGNGGVVNDLSLCVYSFALKPEEHQPSGTCNFSRIDNAQLVFSKGASGRGGTTGINVYAVNYNVLRVMSGMGGLAYSN